MSKVVCDQSINGILLVNKPQGISSNALLQRVKRLYRAKKAGHTGSLDPLATGMLPICFGEATKFSQYLLQADKGYEATGLLGIKTNTADALGEIVEEKSVPADLSESDLRAVMSQFIGSTKQIPSMFSALKHKGTPLYKYARDGVTIEREAREIIIHKLELCGFDGRQFSLEVVCSKGTYIRNLVEDLGDRLGVGAHVVRLHRQYTAGFENEKMYSLDELLERTPEQLLSCLLPLEHAVNYFPQLFLNSDDVIALRQGKVLQNKRLEDEVLGCVRLYDQRARFIGLGDLQDSGVLRVQRLLAN